MPIEEAIRRIQSHIRNHHIGEYPHIFIGEALATAIAALQEKLERENPKLLTMDELKKMNGEPVWVEEFAKRIDATGWAIVEVDDRGTYKGIPFVSDRYCTWNVVSRGLHCYRHKPKEEHHG